MNPYIFLFTLGTVIFSLVLGSRLRPTNAVDAVGKLIGWLLTSGGIFLGITVGLALVMTWAPRFVEEWTAPLYSDTTAAVSAVGADAAQRGKSLISNIGLNKRNGSGHTVRVESSNVSTLPSENASGETYTSIHRLI